MWKRACCMVLIAGALPGSALAVVLSSPSFRLDPNVANTFGGMGSSTSYGLVESGGEATAGSNSSTSYKLTEGYVSELQQSIQLSLSPANITIPPVLSGTSQTSTQTATVSTDGPGYDLGASQNHNLLHTDTVTTIPAVGTSITSPGLWTEGTTTGLGITITAGTQIEAKWGTTPNFKYAAIPGSNTTFHTHSGFGGGASDVTTIQYRLDVPTTQKSGTYTNIVTYTATVKP